MPHIYRDENGKVTGFSKWRNKESQDFLSDDDPEFIAYLEDIGKPQSISMRQLRLAISKAGKLQAVKTAILNADEESRIECEYSKTISRNHVLIIDILPGIGATPEEIDQLFNVAASL